MALEAAESLYHNFSLQLINKYVQIFNWNLAADDKTFAPIICHFDSLSRLVSTLDFYFQLECY